MNANDDHCDQPLPRGYCTACAYPLHGLPGSPAGYRCPECGRAFDPADSKTFRNSAQSRFARWLATPIGWPVVIVSTIAAFAVMSVSRWQLSTFKPSTVDLVYYLRPLALWHRTSLITCPDYVFTAAMLAAIAALCGWVMRLLAGVVVRWSAEYRKPDHPMRSGRRHAILAAAVLLTSTSAALGWPYRLAQQWTAQRITTGRSTAGGAPVVVLPPTTLSDAQLLLTLRTAIMRLPRVEQRMAGLQLLMEDHADIALPILIEAVGTETDSEPRVTELHLIALHRDPQTADLLMRFTTHADAETRAAAVDALSILRQPTYPTPMDPDDPALAGKTRIDLSAFSAQHKVQWNASGEPIYAPVPLPKDARESLETVMLAGRTTEEREAAARALVGWPPESFHLRVAEWGVWIGSGQRRMVQTEIDEIPAFVHRTGNPLSDFDDRFYRDVVQKPVIHITADRPMAVDIGVLIEGGRPWFAYPRPDDFIMDIDGDSALIRKSAAGPLLAPLDNASIEPLPDMREGYPWLEAHHVLYPDRGRGHATDWTGIGVCWQSIIVSPTRLPWMTLADPGTDPRYAWWRRLREVPCAYISSRGESERFLYYDGPSLAAPPVAAALDGNHLSLAMSAEAVQGSASGNPPRPAPQGAILIHRRDGHLTGQSIALPADWGVEHTSAGCTIPNDDLREERVIDAFRVMLQSAGLTAGEAEGLIASCQKQFFQTDGTRLLLIMSRHDYDVACPITIRPTPTETARVGIILTEFK